MSRFTETQLCDARYYLRHVEDDILLALEPQHNPRIRIETREEWIVAQLESACKALGFRLLVPSLTRDQQIELMRDADKRMEARAQVWLQDRTVRRALQQPAPGQEDTMYHR